LPSPFPKTFATGYLDCFGTFNEIALTCNVFRNGLTAGQSILWSFCYCHASQIILCSSQPKTASYRFEEYLNLQRRVAHLFKPQKSEEAIREIQEQLDNNETSSGSRFSAALPSGPVAI
jgi:pyruvate/2-oxoacid:ferredoxin oxidoreductase beta subunit